MSFSEQFIDEIKSRNSIEETVSRYIQLKRAGSNLVGLCPFHNEKSPSFTVFPATKSYYCFGCGAGGDVFSFVMQTEGLDYPSAVESLASRAGIPMEQNNSYGVQNEKSAVSKKRIIEATKEAGKFFYKCLNSPSGIKAREYLEKRKISSQTIKRFGIGYAPDSWDSLTKHLKSLGFSDEETKAAFLTGTSKNGNQYDMFRNRIMFPVFDITGDCVAFSGRRLNEQDERKYINTSDTPAFKKSRVLFGLNIAKQQNDGFLIMCEGAVDAIALQQAGFSNAVATLGTAITSEHARIIARFVKTVFLAYDIDKAGRSATDKAIRLLAEVGVDTKIIDLGKDAKDPDEFIKAYGAEAFRRKLKGSSGQIDYSIDQILTKHNTDNPDEKLRAATELYEFVAKIYDRTEREIYKMSISKKLGISSKVVSDEVEYRVKRNERQVAKKVVNDALKLSEGFGDKANKDKIRFSSTAMLEEKLLGIFLNRPELAKEIAPSVDEELFATEFDKKVFLLFKDEFLNGSEVTLSKDGALSPEELGAVSRMMARRDKSSGNTKEELLSVISALKQEAKKRNADKKISEDPLGGLSDYINSLRKNKSDSEGK